MEEKIWTRDFILICLSNFLAFLGFQMLIPTLPLYVRELGGSDMLIGWVVGIFTFSALLIRPYAGHVIDGRGRKPILFAGLCLMVLSVFSMAWVGHLLLLLLFRIIQGIGWGMNTTASGTVATDLIPPRRRGEGMGYYGLSGNLAMTIGPALGLAIVGSYHFEPLFFLSAALTFSALLLTSQIRIPKPAKALGQKQATDRRASESGKRSFHLDIIEKTALLPAGLILLVTVTFSSISTFLPIYAAQKSVAGVQWYFVMYAVVLMITRPFAGKLYDLKGHRAVFIPGAGLIMAAMFILSGLHGTAMMLLAAALYGAGFGAIQPAMQAWAVQNAPPERRGMANATFFSCFDLGIGLGAIFFGSIAPIIGYGNIYLVAIVPVALSIISYLFFTVLYKKEKQTTHASF